ncbi:hypothetical protein GCM10007394_06970 [Salinibacterium amurskyense]|nr:hypothetical protein GCM10007394_06970 [Salinibacterium amurskyense]
MDETAASVSVAESVPAAQPVNKAATEMPAAMPMIDFFIVSPVAAERFTRWRCWEGDLVLTIVFIPGGVVNAYLHSGNQ